MKKILVVFLLMMIHSLVFSEILLRGNENSIGKHQKYEIEIEFKDQKKGNYTIEGIEKFKIIGKGSQSTTVVINGNIKGTQMDYYTLVPIESGSHSLVVVQDNEKSNTITVTVGDDVDFIQKKASNNYSYNKDEQSNKENKNAEELEDFFIKTNLEKDSIYFGEKIVYEEKLIMFNRVRSLEFESRADVGNLSYIDYTPDNIKDRLKISNEERNGVKGEELLVLRWVLQGNSSGEETITTSSIGVERDRYFIIPPKNKTLTIKSLPQEGRPQIFNGIVGELEVQKEWLKTEFELGKTAVLTVKLSGSVNLDGVDKLNIDDTSNYRVFETLKNKKEEIRNGNYYSERIFEIIFIPNKSGQIKIEDIVIPYFNTETEKYESIKIEGKTLTVSDSVSGGIILENNTTDPNALQEEKKEKLETEVKENNKNIEILRDYKDKETLKNNRKKIYKSIFIIVFIGLVVVILKKYRDFIEKNKSPMKKLRKSKSYSEYYEVYADYMEKKYMFNPKIHSEKKLLSEELREVNRTVEAWKYEGKEFDREKITNILEKLEKKDWKE